MSYLKANTAGVYDIPSANIDTLYIRGKKFQDYITELNAEDLFDLSQIQELKALTALLDTTALTSAWVIDNNNINADLKSAVTALQTKLANIDSTALTQSSVLTNDNRNSVLKTAIDTANSDLTALTSRVTTAEGDIDGVEIKTRFITEASITGTGDNTLSTYTTLVGPTTEENGSTLVELNMKNAPTGELIGYTIKSNFNNDDYDDNESTYSHRDGRLTLLSHTMRLQANQQIRIGNFAQYGDGGASTAINIGGRGQHINIGCIDSLTSTGTQSNIQIGQQSDSAQNTSTRISGNVYLSDARFEDLTKSSPFTLASVIALMSSGPPSWVVGFFSGATTFPYSDVWCMKGGFAGNKKGDVETRNGIMLEELYVVNKSITNITPKVGFFLAKADYSCTQLIGDHRTQVFEGEILLRNNNITSSSVNWALTSANDKCNVVNIGGDSGILIHQGASDTGAPIRIINSCSGNIEFELGTEGTIGQATVSANGGHGMSIRTIPLTDLNGNSYTGGMVRMGLYSRGNPQSNPFWGTYQLEINQYPNREGMIIAKMFQGDNYNITYKTNIINGDSINTQGTITGIDVVGSTSISAPTATATSLVINGNYTGNTDARLYKNADNKLMWNGAEVGAGGVSSGGITYMINVPTNITNPSPTPTETIMTAAYTGNPQRTITQAITSNSAFYIAKYTTEVFDETTSNPVLTGLQQLNQYIQWNSQNHTGQLYGRLWVQATAVGSATLYQRTYASPVTTTAATVLNGTPIPTPKGLYNIKFQRVLFPNINVVVSSGPVVLRFRVEGYDLLNGWTTLATMAGAGQSVASTTNNLSVSLDEAIELNQTSSVNAKTAVRLVLFINSGTGTISQTSAGGEDLGAYSLIAVGANTPGLFRTMLYDGTNAKITVPYSTTPTLIEYDLAIDAPYNVSAFPTPTLSTDLYFIQAAGGGHGTNAITLYFNEGTISHYHSSISPPQTIPTLSQVLNSGATASQAIDMNTNKISGITALEGTDGNWNVKEITAGTNITVSPTTGNYTITNNAPTQDVAGGTGIQIAKNGTTATITNNAPTQDVAGGFGIQIAKNGTTATVINNAAVQNLTASSGISISIDTPSRNATITNTGILGVQAGTGIFVSTTNGVSTITNTSVGGGQAARDQLSATSSVGLVPNKLPHYGQNWTTQPVNLQPEDIFVSHDGKNCVYIPYGYTGSLYVQNSHDSGVTWYNTNLASTNFVSICGSMTGEFLYISRFGDTTGQAPNVVYTSSIFVSYNYGSYWSELTLDRTPGAANTWYNRYIDKIRCSSDGTVVIASTVPTTANSGVANNGTLYISTNSGVSWVVRNITAGPAMVSDCCMSVNGSIMFAAVNGVLGGETDNGNGGIYRSFDFGATWTKVKNQIAPGSFYFGIIKCDATGRFLLACDQSDTQPPGGQIQVSDDYGSFLSWFGDEQAKGATAAFVSPGGNLMITAHHSTSYDSRIRYSIDYGRNWTTAISLTGVISGTIRTLASNHDGSVLLLRAGAAAIYRCIEERGKLEVAATSRELSLTPAFGGGYTLLNNPTSTFWFSGSFEHGTVSPQYKIDFDFLTAGKIDLTQYNIRYEIECYWSVESLSYIYPLLTINDVRSFDIPNVDENAAYGPLSSVTNWTNNINNGSYGGSEVYTQTFRNRYFGGYFPGSTSNLAAPPLGQIRQRSLIKGTLSLHRRPAGDSYDAAVNAKDIYNIFTCDNYATRFVNGMSYVFGSTAQHGIDYGVNHQRINGTGIMSAESVWGLNAIGAGSEMSNGIFRLGFYLSEGANLGAVRPRAANYVYRIYRERK